MLNLFKYIDIYLNVNIDALTCDEDNWDIDWCTSSQFMAYVEKLWILNKDNFKHQNKIDFIRFYYSQKAILIDAPEYFKFIFNLQD